MTKHDLQCNFFFSQPALTKVGILDTCGVNNLHGMPGVYSGLLSVLFAALATTKEYGTAELETVFGAMKNVRGILVLRQCSLVYVSKPCFVC